MNIIQEWRIKNLDADTTNGDPYLYFRTEAQVLLNYIEGYHAKPELAPLDYYGVIKTYYDDFIDYTSQSFHIFDDLESAESFASRQNRQEGTTCEIVQTSISHMRQNDLDFASYIANRDRLENSIRRSLERQD